LAGGSVQGPKEETLDENEWWDRLEKLKVATDQQEVVIKRNFGRSGQEVLEDFAYRLGLHLYAF
jgi:ATP-dependent RNA helicase DHX36